MVGPQLPRKEGEPQNMVDKASSPTIHIILDAAISTRLLIFPTGIGIVGGGGGLLGGQGRRGRYQRTGSYSGTEAEFNEMDRIIRVSTSTI